MCVVRLGQACIGGDKTSCDAACANAYPGDPNGKAGCEALCEKNCACKKGSEEACKTDCETISDGTSLDDCKADCEVNCVEVCALRARVRSKRGCSAFQFGADSALHNGLPLCPGEMVLSGVPTMQYQLRQAAANGTQRSPPLPSARSACRLSREGLLTRARLRTHARTHIRGEGRGRGFLSRLSILSIKYTKHKVY